MKETEIIIRNYRKQLQEIIYKLHDDLPPAAFVYVKNIFDDKFIKKCVILKPLNDFCDGLREDEETLKSKEQ